MSHTNQKKTPIQIIQEFSIPLIAGVILSVIWANLDHHGYEALVHWSPFGGGHGHGHGHHDAHHAAEGLDLSFLNFHFLMNDIFMALFFGIAAKEITDAALPGGALNPPRKAINPLLGTAGGVLGPVGVYFLYVAISGSSEIANGWGIPTATDIALAWLVARIAFGAGHPAVSYLLLLAVADDGLGLGIIAIFYPDPNNPVQPVFLVLVLAAMGIAFALRASKVRNFWLYLAVPGVLSWFGLYLAHLHPALALVAVVPFMPSVDDHGHSGHDSHSTLQTFEHTLKLPVDIGLFGFGLANAGVAFSSLGPATWAVFIGLLAGKTVGIFGFSAIGHMLGFKLPEGMDFKSLLVAGVTASLGLTVALFVSGQAFADPELQGAAKMGALFSAFVAPIVFILAKVLGVHESVSPTILALRGGGAGGSGGLRVDGHPGLQEGVSELPELSEAPAMASSDDRPTA